MSKFFLHSSFHDTMISQFPKKLDPQQSIQTHKEYEEQCYVVNLLGGPLKNLVDS